MFLYYLFRRPVYPLRISKKQRFPYSAKNDKKGDGAKSGDQSGFAHPFFAVFCEKRETLLLRNAKRINGTAEKII